MSLLRNFSQPQGLMPLFFIELWERFGFYAVQAVLVLYLVKSFGFSDDAAYDTFSATAAFLYASPFLGGYLADKYLGYRQAIFLGAVLLILGYWLLMVPTAMTFYWALALLIVGNGFFKGCISTLLGTLYGENDPRRDGGYTIFYMGINTGSLLAPVVSGLVSVSLGWPFVFGFAGGGLVVALMIAVWAFKGFGDKGLAPVRKLSIVAGITIKPLYPILIGCVIVTLLMAKILHNAQLANNLFMVVAIVCVLAVFVLAFRLKGYERSNMMVLSILIVFAILFWAMFMQMFSSLTLFTDRIVDRVYFGHQIHASMFQSIEPFFIIALTPFFVVLWNRLGRKKSKLSSPSMKFTLALLVMALAYLLLVIAIKFHDAVGQISALWLVVFYFLFTVAELLLSPIGLSLVSELAPKRYRGMMMGGWFLSISMGFSLGDFLAKFTSIPTEMIAQKTILTMLPYYSHAFTVFFGLTAVVGLVLFLLVPRLNKATYNDQRLAAIHADTVPV